MRTVPSAEQEARRWQVGLKAKPHTASPWPSKTWLKTLGSGSVQGGNGLLGLQAPRQPKARPGGWAEAALRGFMPKPGLQLSTPRTCTIWLLTLTDH